MRDKGLTLCNNNKDAHTHTHFHWIQLNNYDCWTRPREITFQIWSSNKLCSFCRTLPLTTFFHVLFWHRNWPERKNWTNWPVISPNKKKKTSHYSIMWTNWATKWKFYMRPCNRFRTISVILFVHICWFHTRLQLFIFLEDKQKIENEAKRQTQRESTIEVLEVNFQKATIKVSSTEIMA